LMGSRALNIAIRAGFQTGECEVVGDKREGVAFIGARVGALAEPGEVLVSGTVKGLVVGSGLRIASRSNHSPQGCPRRMELVRRSLASLGPLARRRRNCLRLGERSRNRSPSPKKLDGSGGYARVRSP